MKKRMFSFLLALCMCASLFPLCAAASVRYVPDPWSDWSRDYPPSPPPGCTIDIETRTVTDVPAHTEYRYGRWVGATVNWCKEYGESLHGGTYSVQETEWSTVRATNTETYWLCGHFDWEHSSHIHASGTDHRGYPMWTRYKVDGYSNPDFYWEETRWVDDVTHTEYRYRFVYYDYTVYFDANGGSVSPTSKVVTNGERYGDLPTPTRQYYDFLGWFTERDGGGQITSDSTVNLSGDQTLYAHWHYNPPKYTVTFDANGGSVSPTTKIVIHGERYGDLPVPVRENYDFVGWFTADGVQVTKDSIVPPGDHTLYAHWNYNPPTYIVIFNPTGGTVDPIYKTVTQGETYGELPVPTRTDYKFDDWYTDAEGGTRITSDSTVNLSGTQTLYARWTYVPPTYTVTFNANGGGGSMSPRKVTDDGQFTFPKCDFTAPSPGGRFTAWRLNGNAYQAGDTVTLKDNAKAIAQWSGYDIADVTINGKAATVKLVYALSASASVVVCAYADDGRLLADAVKTVDSGASAELALQTSGAAYLKAFLLDPATCAPLCNPFDKKLS